MLLFGNCLPMRRAAGDCRLRSLNTGNVRDTGVLIDAGVCAEAGLLPVELMLEYGVEGAKMLRPPHF